MPDRPALELFYAMFPGEPRRSVPAACDTGAADRLKRSFPRLDDMDALMCSGVPPDWASDPNGALKALKATAPDLVDLFIEQAIVTYFSDPAVAHALTGKPTPLFPNHTVMPDIDYELLEPVLGQSQDHADD
jgi:hypothetical protein